VSDLFLPRLGRCFGSANSEILRRRGDVKEPSQALHSVYKRESVVSLKGLADTLEFHMKGGGIHRLHGIGDHDSTEDLKAGKPLCRNGEERESPEASSFISRRVKDIWRLWGGSSWSWGD